MNIFSNLPFLSQTPASDRSPEELAAEEKADRIAFHRNHVRNGPARFGRVTAGQERRAKRRRLERQQKKAFDAQKRAHWDNLRNLAVVRSHLQIVGLIPFADERFATPHEQVTSTAWLVQRFGTEVEHDGVKTGHVSFMRDDVLEALRQACRVYSTATGVAVIVPDDFAPCFHNGTVA